MTDQGGGTWGPGVLGIWIRRVNRKRERETKDVAVRNETFPVNAIGAVHGVFAVCC